MRKVALSSLKGSEKLAKSVYDSNGRVLLSHNIKLKDSYIERLKDMGVASVFVHDEISEGIEINEIISDKVRQKAKSTVKKTMERFFDTGEICVKEISLSAEHIIDEILSQKEVIVNVLDIRTKSDYIFAHSVNVCALAVMTGMRLGYDICKLKEIAVGALLHDIGKILIPDYILEKSDDLNSKELKIYEKHPKDGYEALNKERNISYLSKAIVLLHHERWNGTGYPFGLKGEKLNEAIRLVSICNTFDKLTSKINGKRLKIYEAIEYMLAMGYTFFDGELLRQFVNNVAIFPSGSIVLLNTGDKGIVIKQNKGMLTRPVVRLLTDSNGKNIKKRAEIDLSEEKTIFITNILED